jgi:outer membrane protein assembly factor BamD (BamD/ComL family)
LAAPPTPSLGLPKPSTDAGEILALDKIRSALKSGDSAAALAAVSEHEKRYPSGAHVEEREALAVQALARAGRGEEAAARANRFRKRFPGSFLTAVVNSASPP